jgi:hypothetical protein
MPSALIVAGALANCGHDAPTEAFLGFKWARVKIVFVPL